METKSKIYKKLHIYHGVMVLLIAGVIVFFSPVGRLFGLYGSGVDELLLLMVSVLITVLAKADVREVFPLKRPSFSGLVGTFLLWAASYLGVMIVTLILTVFFPQEIAEVSGGLMSSFFSVPFPALFVIVAILPAICEEAVFRGVLINSLSRSRHPEEGTGLSEGFYAGMSPGRKAAVIVITGLIFGAFHGNLFRFFPTALLGMMLGYILIESGNMVYNGLFHCINNAVPVIFSYAMKDIFALTGTEIADGIQMDAAPLLSVGLYLCYGALIPFFLYIGNYLLHSGTVGYRRKLFPSGKPGVILLLIVSTVLFIVAGIAVMLWSVLTQTQII